MNSLDYCHNGGGEGAEADSEHITPGERPALVKTFPQSCTAFKMLLSAPLNMLIAFAQQFLSRVF